MKRLSNRLRTAFILLVGMGWLGVMAIAPVPSFAGTTGRPEGTQAAASGTIYLPYIANATQRCVPEELIRDGSFEAGVPNPAWQVSSNVYSDILDDTPIPPAHSGNWKAWMGGDNRVQEALWQTFTVPADGAGLAVSYWWRVDTFETTHPFDTLEVQIRDANGNRLQVLELLTDGDAGPSWNQSTIAVSGHAGQTIQIAFVAQTDDTHPTSFFIDDVSVRKTCVAQ